MTTFLLMLFFTAFITTILLLELPAIKMSAIVVINAIINGTLAIVLGWLAYIAVKAGAPVDDPKPFILASYALVSVAHMTLAIREHCKRWAGAREQVISAIGGSWLVLVPLTHWIQS